MEKTGDRFKKLVEIMDSLRDDGGCPWDREQDVRSITDYFLEEVYEAVDALQAEDSPAVREELGDVFMELVFLARLFKEEGKFTVDDVLDGINQKMIKRHPHVFGPGESKTASRVLQDWNRSKTAEKRREWLYDGFSQSGPSLLKAFQIGQKASAMGFDWPQMGPVLDKVKEEISELERAVEEKSRKNIVQEMGDLLFSIVNVSRHLKVNPELALRQANQKFISRFHYVEASLKEKGINIETASLEEMEQLWQESKSEEL
ncbi:nucleoside triphosphate pyrophosphohydrolase [Acidobacteriota bacterium]